jgi:hypothetical protein
MTAGILLLLGFGVERFSWCAAGEMRHNPRRKRFRLRCRERTHITPLSRHLAMGTSFVIAGRLFPRRSIIKLSADERAALESVGMLLLTRPVEWPVADRTAFMDRAYVDPGGTDVWGAGPYLKVPNVGPDGDGEVVNRVFCPWGYPPAPLRAFRRNLRMRLEHVEIVRVADAEWEWRLTVKAAGGERRGS